METYSHTEKGRLSGYRLFVAIALILIILHPFLYIAKYAGDGVVHLIFAENTAKGNYFEFNPGEKSAAMTCPGFMLLLSVLFRLFPAALIPAIIKVSNIIFWYGLLFMVFLVAKEIFDSKFWVWLTTLTASLLPGSVYNSTVGMENGIFGFIVVLLSYLMIRWKWLEAPYSTNPWKEAFLGTLMGLACWLRPEAFVVTAIAIIYRGILIYRFSNSLTHILRRSSILLFPFLIITFSLIYFHFSQTGKLLPTSGLARIAQSSREAFWLGPVWVTPKFLIRLLFYFPLTLFWLIGNWLILTKRYKFKHSNIAVFSIILFWTFFILYSTILGSAHLARYIIFIMPFMVLVSIIGAKWIWENWRSVAPLKLHPFRNAVFSILAFGLCSAFLIETPLRYRLCPSSAFVDSMKMSAGRHDFSDWLFDQLGRPSKLPVVLAYEEIQVRYCLDDRFVIRSLDGRTDAILLTKYYTQGNFDRIGYIKETGIRFIMNNIHNNNRNKKLWSLERLNKLKPGESLSHEGLTFLRLPNGAIHAIQVNKDES